MNAPLNKSAFLRYVEANASYKDSVPDRKEAGRKALDALPKLEEPRRQKKPRTLEDRTHGDILHGKMLQQCLNADGYVIVKSQLDSHLVRTIFYNDQGNALTFLPLRMKGKVSKKKSQARHLKFFLKTIFDEFETKNGEEQPVCVASEHRLQFHISNQSEIESEVLSKITRSVPLPPGTVIQGVSCLGRKRTLKTDQCLHRDALAGHTAIFPLSINYTVAVLPGSHKTNLAPEAVHDVTNLVHVRLQPGELLVFDSRLIHSGLRATSLTENPFTYPLTDWCDVSFHAYLAPAGDFAEDPYDDSLPVKVKLGPSGDTVFGKHLSPEEVSTMNFIKFSTSKLHSFSNSK